MPEINEEFFKDGLASRLTQIRGKADKKSFWTALGLDAAQMGRYENGKELPSFKKFCEICKALDLSPSWLLFGKGQMRLSLLDRQNGSPTPSTRR